MIRQDVFEYCRKQYKTEPDYPWKDWSAVLRHIDNNKWYGLVMEVCRDKIGLTGEGEVDILNVKCDPVLSGSLRMQPGFFPAYHMNKEKWVSAILNGTIPQEELFSLLRQSFALTKGK